MSAASARAAGAFADLAVTQIAAGRNEEALATLQAAIRLNPEHAGAFQNMTALLLKARQLRGENLLQMRRHVEGILERAPWAAAYRGLMYAPRFINVEIVSGKCNLKCRMCNGVQAASHPNRLSWMPAERFERMLAASPTVSGITLSSGDSDPLLHPEWEQIIEIARRGGVVIDLFTNGQPLTTKRSRQLVDAGVVSMINFSIDAATAETYARIRGGDFTRLIRNMETLQDMKKQAGRTLPWVSMSFVAMADNIEELPAFVDLAVRLGAGRVYVEDLIGWDRQPNDNHVATENPHWRSFISDANDRAGRANLRLQLPARLIVEHGVTTYTFAHSVDAAVEPECLDKPVAAAVAPSDHSRAGNASAQPASFAESIRAARQPGRTCCGWLDGVFVREDGRYSPCCLVHDVADMGRVDEGPTLANGKFARVKDLLMQGKVFRQCVSQRMCDYVQLSHAAGRKLSMITTEELGPSSSGKELAPPSAISAPGEVSLPVLAEAGMSSLAACRSTGCQ